MCDFMILIMFEEKDSHVLRLKKCCLNLFTLHHTQNMFPLPFYLYTYTSLHKIMLIYVFVCVCAFRLHGVIC